MTKITVPNVKWSAEWDADDPEIERIWIFIKEMIKHLEVDDKAEDEADFMADRIWEKLNTARNNYQKIKKSNFTKLTITQQKDAFEHLYASLWASYKDCFQSLLKTLGYDIGFMFVSDKNFKKQSEQFKKYHPNKVQLVEYAEKLRKGWQNDLAETRNAQHTGDFRNVKVDYNHPQTAKELFEVVCYVIEGVFVWLTEEKLRKGWLIVVVNDNETVFGCGQRFALKHYLQVASENRKPTS